MLFNAEGLTDYSILATDGTIGKFSEFYFNDKYWTVRYVIVDTGKMVPGQQVVISPQLLLPPDWINRLIPVNLNRDQIKNSPSIDMVKPVCRQKVHEFDEKYGWSAFSQGFRSVIRYDSPNSYHTAEQKNMNRYTIASEPDNPYLRSMHELIGYEVKARDGRIGYVIDFLVEENSWVICYLVIRVRKHFFHFSSRKVLFMASSFVNKIIWEEKSIYTWKINSNLQRLKEPRNFQLDSLSSDRK